MLDRATPTSSYAARQIRPVRQIVTITASNLAKAERAACVRAGLAALWINGLLNIEQRTGTLAGQIFGVSAGAVSRELATFPEVPAATAAEQLVFWWNRASDRERAVFGKTVSVSHLWDSAICPNI
jgi:hypothetical protein